MFDPKKISNKNKIISLYLFTFLIKLPFIFLTTIYYDETAYSHTVANIVKSHFCTPLYNSSDLFFFPPLFNYLSAIFLSIGIDRLYAVRLVSLLLSSGITPLLYLIMKQSGNSEKTSFIASFLWLFLPYGFLFSTIGMVETSMIFFLLLSIYFLFAQNTKKNILLSALFLSASIWIKETTIGIVPIFLLIIFLKKRKKFPLFFVAFFLFTFPLILQTFLPHSYDMFFEIDNNLVVWKMFIPDAIITNYATINGIKAIQTPGFYYSLRFLLIFLLFTSLISIKKENLTKNSFLLFSLLSFLLYFLFFSLFPKKFAYYLLILDIFAIPFLARYLATKKILTTIYLSFMIFMTILTMKNNIGFPKQKIMEKVFNIVETQKPNAKIGATLPRDIEYFAQKENRKLTITNNEWMKCKNNLEQCLKKEDYLFTDDYFFNMLFCKQWPMIPKNCNWTKKEKILKKMTLIKKWGRWSLFKIKKEKFK